MIDSVIRHCLTKVAAVIELIKEFNYDVALEELNELVVFLAQQTKEAKATLRGKSDDYVMLEEEEEA